MINTYLKWKEIEVKQNDIETLFSLGWPNPQTPSTQLFCPVKIHL